MHTMINVPTPTGALSVWPPASQAAREQLRAQAVARAHALRNEAIADLWGGAGALWGDAVDQTRRAADRLAARLRQHGKRRALGNGSGALSA